MIQIAIQSDLSKHKIFKLSYSVCDPFQIIRNTGFASYFVRKLNKPDSPEVKFMVYDLCPLPPSLKPCEPVDSTNTRYLNQIHDPLINTLKMALDIKLYDEKWFNTPLQTSTPKLLYTNNTLKFPDESVSPFSSVSKFHKETDICPPIPLIEPYDYSIPPPSTLALHRSFSNSNCLFFIRYIPENNFKRCWFLVRTNHAETAL